jgi:carbon-monoxide dehydrogenase small subunit
MSRPQTRIPIQLQLNGQAVAATVEARTLLSDFIRHDCGLTGTHVGCEHGVCGACTVQMDGLPVRSCLTLAASADGCELRTVEGLSPKAPAGPLKAEQLSALQQAFHEAHGLQCGYCTPGILMTMDAFLKRHPSPSEAEVREALSGNLCRCTGYQHIVAAVMLAASKLQGKTATAIVSAKEVG